MELPTPQDLRERRNELELTQSDLADRAGVSQPLIARIEGGDVDPRLSTLRRIVNALDEAEGNVIRATDIMQPALAAVAPDDSVGSAEEMMNERGFSQLPVVQGGVPVGSISHSDVIEAGGDGGEHRRELVALRVPVANLGRYPLVPQRPRVRDHRSSVRPGGR